MTHWIILRDGKRIYSTTSKPRFDVQFAKHRDAGESVDWTTEFVIP